MATTNGVKSVEFTEVEKKIVLKALETYAASLQRAMNKPGTDPELKEHYEKKLNEVKAVASGKLF